MQTTNEDFQQAVVTTLGKNIAIIRDSEITVTGRTLGAVAEAYAELQSLERGLAFGELVISRDEFPPVDIEESTDDSPTEQT